ncbi:MAG: substrate-binding domain-containing protein [Eubacteriales bacterium]
MKKRLMIVAMVCILVLSFAGCSTQSTEPADNDAAVVADDAQAEDVATEDQKYVIFVNPLVGNPVFTAEENGLKAAAEEFGFKLKITGIAEIDELGYAEALEAAIAEKPDAIVAVPYSWSGCETVYKKAAEAGIPIFNTSSDSPAETRVTYVGTDNKAYGIYAADQMAEQMGGVANIAIMMVRVDVPNQLEIKTAFEARLAEKYPDMKVVITEQSNGDPLLATEKFQQIFAAHPEVDAALMLEAQAGNACAQVVKEKDLVGKVTILAVDDIQETIDNVDSGVIWGTMVQNFYKMGYESGRLVLEYYAGEEIPSTVDSGTLLVTEENVDTYQEELYQ